MSTRRWGWDQATTFTDPRLSLGEGIDLASQSHTQVSARCCWLHRPVLLSVRAEGQDTGMARAIVEAGCRTGTTPCTSVCYFQSPHPCYELVLLSSLYGLGDIPKGVKRLAREWKIPNDNGRLKEGAPKSHDEGRRHRRWGATGVQIPAGPLSAEHRIPRPTFPRPLKKSHRRYITTPQKHYFKCLPS